MEINHNKVRNESRNLQHQNTFTLGLNSSKRPPLTFICPNLQLSIKLLTEKRIQFQDSENILNASFLVQVVPLKPPASIE